MSEPKKTTQETEQEEEKVEKKPVAKKTVKKDDEKEKFSVRAKKWWNRNKKALGAFGIGVGTGAAGAVTYGIVRNRIKRKKQEEIRYIPEEQTGYNGSPLDPNV